MPVIFLTRPPYAVDAGPFPGVYSSREAYEDHLRRQAGLPPKYTCDCVCHRRDEEEDNDKIFKLFFDLDALL